jgi:virginiamycin B lyase
MNKEEEKTTIISEEQSIAAREKESRYLKNMKNISVGNLLKKIEFIQEYSIPVIACSEPVGIAVDDNNNKIWIAATWVGYLVIFDPDLKRFVDFIEIPNWRTKGIFGSMVWGMEFDKKGNLWFTDQVNNAIWRYFTAEKRFEMYKVPTKGSYPGQVSFDFQGRVWFSEIFGKKIGVINPDEAVDNTTRGITEYELELEGEGEGEFRANNC